MFKLVQILGRLLVHLYRSESARLVKASQGYADKAIASAQAAQAHAAACEVHRQSSHDARNDSLVKAERASQLEAFFK